ncbi:MAG: protein-disulfide reductase DsbD [Gammaproteobacteria bacterium]|nr:protein-disulfide reductase DsbD [Gammaproteobacteria bacterium]
MLTFTNTKRLLAIAAVALLSLSVAAQDDDILHPEEAYRYAVSDTGSALEIDWAIEEGYYLYRQKLSFKSNTASVQFGNFELPQGLPHEDEFFGAQQVYRDRFFVTIPYTIIGERPASMQVEVKSQGCADIGICYPPQTWTSDVRLISASTTPATKLTLGNSIGSSEFLPVDEAFKPVLIVRDGNTIDVAFQVTPGYYLYKDKLSVSSESTQAQLGQLELPAGEKKVDEWFGEMEVYHDDVFALLPIARAAPDAMDLTVAVAYQGCADGGLCYPPQVRDLTVALPAVATVTSFPAATTAAAAAPVSEQAKLAQLISGSSIYLVIATFFGAGLLLAFTPCVLPMVPILSGIIAGEGDDVSSARGFSLALSYVMGMALIYTGAGIVAAAIGVQLQAVFNAPWVLILFSGLFVVLAMGMFGLFELQMPSSLQSRLATISGNQKTGTVVGAFVMGALSSLIVTACVAPPLVATLTVIGQSGDMLRGGTALFALSLGMGAPLLIVGASAGKLLPKVGPWMVAVKNAFGFMMLGLAIWMLSRILADEITLALWGVLTLMAGVFLGGLTTITVESGGSAKLGKGFGLIAVIYGAVMLLGSLSGGHNPLQPLAGISLGNGATVATTHELEFRRIKTVADLDRALLDASRQGKTTMLDFYADWCVSCKEMEAYTFTDADVQQTLSNTVLLQADVTANDDQDQELLQHFGVFGPPTIILFGADGQQRNGYEVVGYMKAEAFSAHLKQAFSANATTTANADTTI